MSAWRRKALALFPEHHGDFSQPDTTLPDALWTLYIDAETAHERFASLPPAETRDTEAASVLRRVHGFLEWCLHEGTLWEAAAIGFYENLFHGVPWDRIAPWLSPFVVEQIENTWALGTRGEHASEFAAVLQARRHEHFRTHVYSTGQIEAL
jgi:hypothetical protein